MKELILLIILLCIYQYECKVDYACANCNDIPPRLEQFCQTVVMTGQPCRFYRLVWRRLCRRTCLAVNRMKCTDSYQICNEDPDCPLLCKMFFDQLCPLVEDAGNLANKEIEESFLQIASRKLQRQQQTLMTSDSSAARLRGQMMGHSHTPYKMKTYSVRPGEYLGDIAKDFGSTEDLIMQANPQIQSRDLLFPGMKLRIPVAQSSKTPPVDPCPGMPLY